MNIFMNPALPENISMAVNDRVEQLTVNSGESFSSYLEKIQDLAADKNERLLGVKNPQGANDELDNRILELIDEEDITTVPGLLEHMMMLLQEQAEKIDNDPGDWILTLPDTGLLEKMALAAGMTEEEAGQFIQGLFPAEGDLNLAGLLQDLASHFNQMTNDSPITVPDTEFPLFAALLSKMGLSMDQIENIADQAINGQDQLDLELFSEVLNNLTGHGQLPESGAENLVPVQLRGWEADQLQRVLRQMGVSEEGLGNLSLPMPGENSSLNLQKLTELITGAVELIQSNKAKPDVINFLDRLDRLFNEAGFKEQSTTLTPVVQNSIEQIFNKLMETVDLSQIRLQVVDNGTKSPADEVPVVGLMVEEGLVDGQEENFFTGTEEKGKGENSSKMPDRKNNLLVNLEAGLTDNRENPVTIHFDSATITVTGEAENPHNQSVQELNKPMAFPRTNQLMVQQTIDQLSQAVARGAERNEHHLIIRLYPEDLGEVKVNLHIRDEQVSVSFTMENSRVKDILESNMQDFKNSMEKHGFNLGDLSASVDKQDQDNAPWQSFSEFMRRNGNMSKGNLADLPEDVLYRRPEWVFPKSEIDLRV